MSRIRSRNTSPERAVRNALWHSKAPIKYVVTFTNLKFRLVTPYRSLVIDQ
ncbi:MAG: very short patch repair endonuclease [Bacteroidales bacterium]|nr:very short patch repair endonuclease [Bacteroidales bacterium]